MAGSVSSPLERAVRGLGARNHRRVVGRVGRCPVTGVPEVVPAVAFRDEGPFDAVLVWQVGGGRPAAEQAAGARGGGRGLVGRGGGGRRAAGQTAPARAAGEGAKIVGERLDDDVSAAAPVAPPT